MLHPPPGQVVSRFTILDEVWDGETDLRSNVIDVYLASIRAKIDRPFGTPPSPRCAEPATASRSPGESHRRAAALGWPLRLRLVAGFAAAMLVLLTAAGAFVYWRWSTRWTAASTPSSRGHGDRSPRSSTTGP